MVSPRHLSQYNFARNQLACLSTCPCVTLRSPLQLFRTAMQWSYTFNRISHLPIRRLAWRPEKIYIKHFNILALLERKKPLRIKETNRALLDEIADKTVWYFVHCIVAKIINNRWMCWPKLRIDMHVRRIPHLISLQSFVRKKMFFYFFRWFFS